MTVYIVSAGLILLPVLLILIILVPGARFTPPVPPPNDTTAAPATLTARFTAEPDERENSWQKDPDQDAARAPAQAEESSESPHERPVDADAPLVVAPETLEPRLFVRLSEATTSLFLFSEDSPTPWNPGIYPAPIDHVFLRIHLELGLDSGDPVRLTFGNGSPSPSDVVLKTDDGQVIPVLGRVEDPPNLIHPISSAPVLLATGEPTQKLILAAAVPSSARSLDCMLGSWHSFSLNLNVIEPQADVDAIVGTWTKAHVQTWRTRYPDRLVDSIRRDNQRRLLVNRIPDRPDQYRVQFPICEIEGTASLLENRRGEYWRVDLTHEGRSKRITARLAGDGAVLILYFADSPFDRFVYFR